MDRLTKKYESGWGFVDACYEEYGEINQELVAGRLADYEDAEQGGRLFVLPEVSPLDMNSFISGLHDYFKECAFVDRSVGLYGMSLGETKLANALMDALTRSEAEAALAAPNHP